MEADYAAVFFLVFDHQNGWFSGHGFAYMFRCSYCATGRYTRNTLPSPSVLSTIIWPPCSSTILDTIARPRPTPSGLVVKNGLKMESRCWGSMPTPRSITAISTDSPAARVFTLTAPPGGDACTALRIRL